MNKQVLSWLLVAVFIGFMAGVVVMLNPEEDSSQEPQAVVADTADKAPSAPVDGSIYADGSMTLQQMAEKAGTAFANGDFETCSKMYRELSEKASSADVWQGYFHCEYQRLKADFTKGELPPEVAKPLRKIAQKAEAQSQFELDHLAMSIIWLMMRDRENCAANMERMRDAMLQDPELTVEEQKQLVEETRALVEYIRDSRNSFEAVQMQMAQAIGI